MLGKQPWPVVIFKSVVMHVHAGPNVSSPKNLTSRSTTNDTNSTSGVEVHLSWSPPSDTPDDVEYHINITMNSFFIVKNEVTISPCFNASLKFNETYQVSIFATVCNNNFVSDSLETELIINAGIISDGSTGVSSVVLKI